MIECKVAKRKPWVVFTRDLRIDDTEGQFHLYRAPASRIGLQFLLRLRRLPRAAGRLPLFAFAQRPAYGLQQANFGNEGDIEDDRHRDPAFDSAAKIAHAAILQGDIGNSEEYTDTPIGHIVVPVIVLDGRLFDAHLDASNELIVSEVDSAVLDWRNPVGGRSPTWIRIVTESALGRFIAEAHSTAEFLQNHCTDITAN